MSGEVENLENGLISRDDKWKSQLLGLTVMEIHNFWLEKFTEAGVAEPKDSAGHLFAHLFGKTKLSQVATEQLSKKMSEKDIVMAEEMCRKRLSHMPVQYLSGVCEFFGITLKMRAPVFIPQRETEKLAEYVLDDLQTRIRSSSKSVTLKVLEIGCGSGAITLSLLKKLAAENVEFTAIDAAIHAVDLSRENAQLLALDTTGKLKICHQILGDDVNTSLTADGPFDVIVSNPPYVPTSSINKLSKEIQCYEDRLAVNGGADGCEIIRKILKHAQHLLVDHGSLWLEVYPAHRAIIGQNPVDRVKMVDSYVHAFGTTGYCLLKKTP